MMRIEWRDAWINTLIDAGLSANTAREKYQAIYADDGPDITKNAVHEARMMLEKLKSKKNSSTSEQEP